MAWPRVGQQATAALTKVGFAPHIKLRKLTSASAKSRPLRPSCLSDGLEQRVAIRGVADTLKGFRNPKGAGDTGERIVLRVIGRVRQQEQGLRERTTPTN